ncbi:unnamed protein product, partial [Iphiclides podalirius]
MGRGAPRPATRFVNGGARAAARSTLSRAADQRTGTRTHAPFRSPAAAHRSKFENAPPSGVTRSCSRAVRTGSGSVSVLPLVRDVAENRRRNSRVPPGYPSCRSLSPRSHAAPSALQLPLVNRYAAIAKKHAFPALEVRHRTPRYRRPQLPVQ